MYQVITQYACFMKLICADIGRDIAVRHPQRRSAFINLFINFHFWLVLGKRTESRYSNLTFSRQAKMTNSPISDSPHPRMTLMTSYPTSFSSSEPSLPVLSTASLTQDPPTTPLQRHTHGSSSTDSFIPNPPFIETVPNYFLYEDALWSVKVALPLALFIQTIGHLLVMRVWKRRKRRCDSLVLVLNYIAADTVFVVYLVVIFSLTVTSCVPVQILYTVSISLPISAVCLITLKRFIRVIKPLRCSYIVTKGRELMLVVCSWLIIVLVAVLALVGWCDLEINNEVDYCYYPATSQGGCRFYIALQLAVYFVIPLVSVLVMYGVMLRESRKAFQREAFVSFINMNR